jgi:AraC-like DNA-binding protein
LKRDPIARLDNPFHVLFYYLPRRALDAVADDAEAPRIGDLNHKPWAVDDPTIFSLSKAVLPAIRNPEQANRLFIDHILLAFGIYVARNYGDMRPLPPLIRGGLTPWQLRRAKEILSASLDRNLTLGKVALECGLSVSHFSRAFRQTVGIAPHQWLLTHRIELAKEKLRDRRLSLHDIAVSCGFADQSHLTRTFTRIVRITPGAWRRALD